MDDKYFMEEALKEAQAAFDAGEIPVGAVVVQNGAIIGRGRNRRAEENSPLAHAEIEAIRNAAQNTGGWRFDDCTLYVTLEPCAMCAGAIVQCRFAKIVYGAKDPKAGAVGSLYNIAQDPRMYHRCAVVSGTMQNECAEILRRFFAKKRARS